MTTLTEARHPGEFLVSEANGTRSREVAPVASGQVLKAGHVVQDNGSGKLVAFTGDTDTNGDVIVEAAGVLFAPVDASGGEVAGQVYFARDAEVNLAELTHPVETTSGGETAATVASLKKLGIIAR